MRFDTELEVRLDYFASNLEELKKFAPQNQMLLMLKANGYGHGASTLANFAYDYYSHNEFGLASLHEGIELRKSLGAKKCDLYIFSDLNFYDQKYFDFYRDYSLIPVISDLDYLKIFLTQKQFDQVPLVLKIDTGMYRIGIHLEEIEKAMTLIKSSKRKTIDHLMSHFSCSSFDVNKNNRTKEQASRFQTVKKLFISSGIEILNSSISNSGAIEQRFGLEETHIRPGITLYGPSSLMDFENSEWKGKAISSLKTRVIKYFKVDRGTPIGYGGTVTSEEGFIAVLPLGYGDGISRYYSGLKILLNGFEGKIFGRVNMDLISIFFPISRAPSFKIGDEVLFWDHDSLEINRRAKALNTISYELFCNISSRIPRKYRLK